MPYDYQASLFAEATGKRLFIPKALMMYRQHGGNAIGAISNSGNQSDLLGNRSRISRTLASGIGGAFVVTQTLNIVRDYWKPEVQKEIDRLSILTSAGFSLRKLYYAIVCGFQFYRRKDRVNLLLYALGLPNLGD